MINLNNNTTIKQLYDQLSEQLLIVFTNMEKNPSFKMDKNSVLISFDAFIQCIIVKAVLHKRSFEVGELNYIKNLVKFSDFFKNYNVIRDTYPSKEIEEAVYNESSQYVKQVPDVATMSILVDHKMTFSRMLYTCFEEIITTVVDDLEDPYASKLLSPIKEFFAKNHVLEFEYNE